MTSAKQFQSESKWLCTANRTEGSGRKGDWWDGRVWGELGWGWSPCLGPHRGWTGNGRWFSGVRVGGSERGWEAACLPQLFGSSAFRSQIALPSGWSGETYGPPANLQMPFEIRGASSLFKVKKRVHAKSFWAACHENSSVTAFIHAPNYP